MAIVRVTRPQRTRGARAPADWNFQGRSEAAMTMTGTVRTQSAPAVATEAVDDDPAGVLGITTSRSPVGERSVRGERAGSERAAEDRIANDRLWERYLEARSLDARNDLVLVFRPLVAKV